MRVLVCVHRIVKSCVTVSVGIVSKSFLLLKILCGPLSVREVGEVEGKGTHIL